MSKEIKLSDHFTYGKLLKFTFPSIIMMVVISIYGVVDGFFVSNFVGKTPFAAVNFIMPFLMVPMAVGFMIGGGGSALISCTLGEQQPEKANRIFSLLVYFSIILGIIIAIAFQILLRPVAIAMGASGQLLEDCVLYGRVIILGIPFNILQMEFQTFFVTAEKPRLGLWATVGSGVANVVLDLLLVALIPCGLVGAAVATTMSQVVGGVVPLWYFFRKNTSLLRLGKTHYDSKAILKTCFNGSSELLSNVSMSIVNMLYNVQLLNIAGENGVAAYGAIMYVNLLFLSAFIGHIIGTGPIVGYHYGAQNHKELRSLLQKSLVIIGGFSVAMVALSIGLSRPLSMVFVGYDKELLELTVHGFIIFSVSFLFVGYAMFFSSFFTALGDGLTSAIISFMRTLVFQIAAVMLLPLIWGIDGIWWSISVAEAAAVAVGLLFLFIKQKKYHY